MSFEIKLFFPDGERTTTMPFVPGKGDIVEWGREEAFEGRWVVSEVVYMAYPDREGAITLTLDPPPSE
ncbi:hypothetical protein ACFVYT_25070 [Streptomyces sp. NPDC058290]|uniref:hypothetical protein n=1 Tax=Streptomyces sp. NPDC058290 TaxID=3346426 RepID=UPI0036E15923